MQHAENKLPHGNPVLWHSLPGFDYIFQQSICLTNKSVQFLQTSINIVINLNVVGPQEARCGCLVKVWVAGDLESAWAGWGDSWSSAGWGNTWCLPEQGYKQSDGVPCNIVLILCREIKYLYREQLSPCGYCLLIVKWTITGVWYVWRSMDWWKWVNCR